jgi:Fe-S cluster biogenesis protein NfuA
VPLTFFRDLFRREKPEPVEDQGELFRRVQDAMSDVQAYARSHGGMIHLVSVREGGEVQLRLTGTCKGCPMSQLTLKNCVEEQLRRMIPEVRRVTQVK